MSNGRHHYVAFYPSDWLAGTARMTPLQEITYFRICCYIWDRAEPCPAAELPLMLGAVEGWREIVEALVARRKLGRLANGDITNKRALTEATESLELWQRKSAGGRAGAEITNRKRTNYGTPDGSLDESPVSTPDGTPGGISPGLPTQNRTELEEDTPLSLDKNLDLRSYVSISAKNQPISDQKLEINLALNAYQTVAKDIGLSQVHKFTKQRRAKLRVRLEENGLEGWKAALDKLRGSSFCKGGGKDGWKADFDFLLQEKSFTRLMEGVYDDRTKPNETADRTTGPAIGYISPPKIDISRLDAHGNYIPELGGSRSAEENRLGRPLESTVGCGQNETNRLQLRAQPGDSPSDGDRSGPRGAVAQPGDDRPGDRALPDQIHATDKPADTLYRANGSGQSGDREVVGSARQATRRQRLVSVTPEDLTRLAAAELIKSPTQIAPQMPEIAPPAPVEHQAGAHQTQDVSKAVLGQIFEQQNYLPVDKDWPEMPEFMRR